MIKLSEESVFYLPKELGFFFRVPLHSVVNFKVHKLQNGTGFSYLYTTGIATSLVLRCVTSI